MELSAKNIEVAVVSSAFCDWDALLMLLRASFAYQHGRIDPPSSLCALASADLAAKATVETLFLATEADALIGCLFAKRMANTLYLNKFAVLPQRQQCGIGKRLSNVAEQHARSLGLDALTLNTRIELTDNHATFEALGFAKLAEHAHNGYDRPTFISMRKALPARAD